MTFTTSPFAPLDGEQLERPVPAGHYNMLLRYQLKAWRQSTNLFSRCFCLHGEQHAVIVQYMLCSSDGSGQISKCSCDHCIGVLCGLPILDSGCLYLDVR